MIKNPKKIIIAPDSFKGSLSAREFCSAAKEILNECFPHTEIISMPLADGGEGTLDCMLSAMKGRTEKITVNGPFMNENTDALLGFFEGGKTAVVETSMAMGLPKAGERKNPMLTTTFGAGQMCLEAIRGGAEKIILTLGGSSTNDCGAGLLCALGAEFFNEKNEPFIPVGKTLKDVTSADFSRLKKITDGIEFTAMCDVKNPLCGINGCSYVYGPQKGADEKSVKLLDEGCRHFASVISSVKGKDFSSEPGAGAAGGSGFAAIAGLNGKLQSGIDVILSLYDFNRCAEDADFVITGEGCFDSQSLMGKTIGGISERLVKSNSSARIVVFCGKSDAQGENLNRVDSVVEISSGVEFDYAMTHAGELLKRAVKKWCTSI